MFDKKKKARLMYWSLELLLVAGLIFMCSRLDFLFKPIGTFISTLFAPIIISGFLFYLLNPLVNLLMKVRFKGGTNVSGGGGLFAIDCPNRALVCVGNA